MEAVRRQRELDAKRREEEAIKAEAEKAKQEEMLGELKAKQQA